MNNAITVPFVCMDTVKAARAILDLTYDPKIRQY